MKLLKSKYPSLKIGYSDHTGNPLIAIAAYQFGADFVEQHVVFSKEQYGPDTSSSVDIDQAGNVQNYATLICNLHRSADLSLEESNVDTLGTKRVFSRGLALRASLKKGDLLLEDNVTMKKPSGPLSWEDKALIIGKKAARDLDASYHLNFSDFD